MHWAIRRRASGCLQAILWLSDSPCLQKDSSGVPDTCLVGLSWQKVGRTDPDSELLALPYTSALPCL